MKDEILKKHTYGIYVFADDATIEEMNKFKIGIFAAMEEYALQRLAEHPKQLHDAATTLDRTLTKEEQTQLIFSLFGFSFDDDVLLDSDGKEFYAIEGNSNFYFTTLAGIIAYTVHLAKSQGYSNAQNDIKMALGIN